MERLLGIWFLFLAVSAGGFETGQEVPDEFSLRPDIVDYLDTRRPHHKTELDPWTSELGEEGQVENVDRLRFVIAVFRHGVRSPSKTYNGDPYPFSDTKYWPDGPKQLTKVGKNQLYTLGQTLRKRYGGFLSDEYRPSDVLVKSNLYDRHYMSAACLLAGLYPPVAEYQLWNATIPWQPIPIWGDPYDFVEITTSSSLCPKYYQRMMEAVNAANEYTPQFKGMLDSLKARSGMRVDILSDVYMYYDTFSLQVANGYTGLPNWSLEAMHNLTYLHAALMSVFTSATPQQTALLAGPKLADYAERLRAKTSGASELKFYMEAVHETTLNGLLPAFGFIKPFVVDTSAMFLIEMFESQSPGKYTVRLVYYKNSTVTRPEILKMENCPKNCQLEDVLEIMDNLTPTDWTEECKIK